AMLRAGTIRRVRQTLLATNLADGALVAWKVPADKVDNAFDWMFQCDPFSGHVVLRSTDTVTAGSDYKLWTTVKVPHGFSLQQHCELLLEKVGAEQAGISVDEFYRVAEQLNARKIIGRFSTFLEHVKPSAGGIRVTRFNALFHWAVPSGRELEAGGEVGRHHILTHCYWREAGPE